MCTSNARLGCLYRCSLYVQIRLIRMLSHIQACIEQHCMHCRRALGVLKEGVGGTCIFMKEHARKQIHTHKRTHSHTRIRTHKKGLGMPKSVLSCCSVLSSLACFCQLICLCTWSRWSQRCRHTLSGCCFIVCLVMTFLTVVMCAQKLRTSVGPELAHDGFVPLLLSYLVLRLMEQHIRMHVAPLCVCVQGGGAGQ